MTPGESPRTPLYMRITGNEASTGKFILIAAFSLAPVAVAILMQNPSLRQAIAMKFWNKSEVTVIKIGGIFDRAAKTCHMKYDLARL